MEKNDTIKHRAVIRYLGLNCLTPKQVHQDMEATLGEDTPSHSMVKKWAGEFTRDRESLKDEPVQEDCKIPLSIFHFQGLKVNACVKDHLEPTHLKPSPLFTFSTKS